MISHDLGLLDEAITRVLHLDREEEEADGVLVEYKGTYSQYLEARAADEERLTAIADRQAKEIARLTERADSMRGQTAKRARVAKNLDVRAARIARDQVFAPSARRKLDLRLPDPPPVGRTVLEGRGLAKSYGDLEVFSDIDFDLGRGERLLIMGLNGAGKTTLLKLVADRLVPDAGELHLDRRALPGYYAQEHEDIREGRSLIDHMHDASGAGEELKRALLGMFGLVGDKVFQDAGSLSGGEKTKLALAQLVVGEHNLLLLDEPTNNLDPMSRTAIGEALADWPGTMVLVSHDVEFVQALRPDRVLLMPEGTLDHFSEDMLDQVALA